ncbi:uncharacterized protein LOC127749932 isoform X2 [Frankliniella occidentalis]|uniref:Uncharacterized protein LOC127749932 isoform X2 n=1 Tax=Frankliniella occidentalis TaxID=133901 RepID=A0A9C6X044_FRAOC|nr:uncharacterized protein LOC127749932 isoform X2 [Frankliniella occidentalis]
MASTSLARCVIICTPPHSPPETPSPPPAPRAYQWVLPSPDLRTSGCPPNEDPRSHRQRSEVRNAQEEGSPSPRASRYHHYGRRTPTNTPSLPVPVVATDCSIDQTSKATLENMLQDLQ